MEIKTETQIEVERRLCEAMRGADLKFDDVGGSTRSFAIECLLPELHKQGLAVMLADIGEPENG